jgi:hypothetical protein
MSDIRNSPPEPENHKPLEDVQSLSRLVIGGAEISAIELMRRLRLWELQVAEVLHSGEVIPPGSPAADSPNEQARFALIGLVFELQERARQRLGLFSRLRRLAFGLLDASLRPLFNSRLAAPARQRIDHLAARGQQEVSRWVERGRLEEERSRILATLAFDETVDAFLEYLTQNPEVRDLVQSQSTGLANEVLEEARERAVSADHFLESLARSLLRRVPRSRLPEPPPELRQGAKTRHAGRDKRA